MTYFGHQLVTLWLVLAEVLSTALVAAMPVMLLSLANMMMFNTFIGSMQMH